MRHLWLLCLAPTLGGFAPVPAGAPVQIVVTNVREAKGIIHVELCPERLFLKKCPYAAETVAKLGEVTLTIANIPPGRYAAQAYHDRNRNGKADRNFIGMPTEDVGFSNNALVKLAPPEFARAAFDHGTQGQRITFRMRKVP